MQIHRGEARRVGMSLSGKVPLKWRLMGWHVALNGHQMAIASSESERAADRMVNLFFQVSVFPFRECIDYYDSISSDKAYTAFPQS